MSTLSIQQFIRCSLFSTLVLGPTVFVSGLYSSKLWFSILAILFSLGGSSFLWDLSPLIELRRDIDFQFIKLFPYCEHRIDSFQAPHMPDQNLGVSPLPGATLLVLLLYLLLLHTTLVICVCFSRSSVYLEVKLLSHRAYIIIFTAQW